MTASVKDYGLVVGIRFWPRPHMVAEIGSWRWFLGWRGFGLCIERGATTHIIGVMGNAIAAWPWRWVNVREP